jgi:hypothetical protein
MSQRNRRTCVFKFVMLKSEREVLQKLAKERHCSMATLLRQLMHEEFTRVHNRAVAREKKENDYYAG